MTAPRRRPWLAGTALAMAVAVMVAGTFAPWLRSGQVTRNSYRTAGLFRRLLDLHGAAGAALDAMPALALLCAVGGALFVLGRRRSAMTLLTLLALALAALSVAVLLAPDGRGVVVVSWGPAITLGGAVAAIVAVVAMTTSVFTSRADRDLDRSRQSGWNGL